MNTSVALSNSQEQTMSSREIAELAGKKLSNVHRDIRVMLDAMKDADSVSKVVAVKDRRGYTAAYSIPKHLADLVLSKYKGLARVPMRLQEEAALKTVEQLLGVQLIRQFRCLSYRIDGYDSANNVAYEIDEPAHRYKHAKDAERQQKIEAVLGCKFVRIAL